MLDKKTDAVLELLINKASDGYRVLNKEQLLDELPSKFHIDTQALLNIINFLKEDEYVDVKYQDKEEICLTTTAKASSYRDGEKNIIQKANITGKQVGLLLLGVFFAAFVGTLLATIIGKLL